MFLCNKNMTFYVHFMYVVLIFHFWTFYYIKHVLFIFHSSKNAFLLQLCFARMALRAIDLRSHRPTDDGRKPWLRCIKYIFASNTFLHQIHFCIKCIFVSNAFLHQIYFCTTTMAAKMLFCNTIEGYWLFVSKFCLNTFFVTKDP